MCSFVGIRKSGARFWMAVIFLTFFFIFLTAGIWESEDSPKKSKKNTCEQKKESFIYPRLLYWAFYLTLSLLNK